MAVPNHLSGGIAFPSARGGNATAIERSMPAFEVLKVRVLIKLQDRLDPAKARKMPPALFQQTARQQVEQVIDAEGLRLSPTERLRLCEEVFREAYGYGPLEELFPDANIQEILVLGPNAVVVRREQGWVPTNVKFRDLDHILEVVERIATMGEAVATGHSTTARDVRLGNGYRMISVIPPAIMDQMPQTAFIRCESGSSPNVVLPPITPPPPAIVSQPAPRKAPGTGMYPASGRPAATTVGSPVASPAAGEAQFARHRARITERILSKMASMGVYDMNRLDVAELRKIITAYVGEYCRSEKVYLSDTDQGRLMLEILTGMKR